jgi:hypothetical protein
MKHFVGLVSNGHRASWAVRFLNSLYFKYNHSKAVRHEEEGD